MIFMELKMKVINKKINSLVLYENNSRLHSDKQINQIVNSISEFGFTNPILIDENQMVLAGHGRLKAAEILDLKNVPTIQISNLSESQKKAYVIADNKLALNADWNDDLLQNEVLNLVNENIDLTLLGFNQNEIDSFLNHNLNEQLDFEKDYTGSKEILLNDINKFDNKCPRCGFEFDN